MNGNQEIGRVLRANTSGFEFGCRVHQLEMPVAFGGLVKAETEGGECIYGLIYNIHIDDDPFVGQLVLTNNLEASDIKDQRENRVVPIEMSVLAVGYRDNGSILYGFPPRPPLNLDPVVMVDAAEIIQFSDKLSYLRLILRSAQSGVPIDQLLVAHIRDTHELRGNDNDWAMGAIDELIELLRSEYSTLIPTLEALSDALPLD